MTILAFTAGVAAGILIGLAIGVELMRHCFGPGRLDREYRAYNRDALRCQLARAKAILAAADWNDEIDREEP